MLLLYLDKAVQDKLKGLSINGKQINPITLETFRALKDETKYPSITFQRIDRLYDAKRFSLLGYQYQISNDIKDSNGTVISNEVYDAPRPYNFLYQVECVAKELYHIDTLEMFIEGVINARGDVVNISYKNLENNSMVNDVFPIEIADYKKLDEDGCYRRVFTYRVKTSIDFNKLISVNVVNKGDVQTNFQIKG